MSAFGRVVAVDQLDPLQAGQGNQAETWDMATIVNLHEAKASLSRLVDEAAAGEEIIITKAGVPRARLVALAEEKSGRRPGGWKGGLWVSDDFDAPLPPDVLASFYSE